MNLIIAPHVDDEVLGCGGIIDEGFHVIFCGIQDFHIVPAAHRITEIECVAEFLGYTWEIWRFDKVNNYNLHNFITPLEQAVNHYKPEIIFLPHPSYNQDHQEIYKAAMIALRRHDKNFFVKKVLIYEETDCLWGCDYFKPNYFVPINITKKITAYEKHSSQVRDHRSFDIIKTIAELRGFVSNTCYAEAFEVLRWVD